MSTSLLYHGFGLVGYKYVNTLYEKGALFSELLKIDSLGGAPTANPESLFGEGKN